MDGGGGACSGGGNAVMKVATGLDQASALQDMGSVRTHITFIARNVATISLFVDFVVENQN